MGGNVPLTSVQLARVTAAADGDPDWLVFQSSEGGWRRWCCGGLAA